MNNIPNELVFLIIGKLNICKFENNFTIIPIICKKWYYIIKDIKNDCKIIKYYNICYCRKHVFQSIVNKFSKWYYNFLKFPIWSSKSYGECV